MPTTMIDLDGLSPQSTIVILTGAGISRESGLATFRDADGIWATLSIEEVATPAAFARDPTRVHAFYNARRRQMLAPSVQPNVAHRALAELESFWPGEVVVVTQNIDDLHERGGTTAPVHMHGELWRSLCMYCRDVRECRTYLGVELACTACGRTGGMRPNVVWFHEMPYHMDRIGALLTRCGLFVSVGTSGNVYPAAGFVQEARFRGGAQTIELNLEPSEGYGLFHAARHGPATQLVPDFVAALRQRVYARAG
ncbi:MAG: NAD-dependent deacylase [Alphaproteobacteria bacterium]|nr:NAD-dependent deacylase [Alphaproteobacteria bacterium]